MLNFYIRLKIIQMNVSPLFLFDLVPHVLCAIVSIEYTFLKHVAHVYMFDSYCTRIAFPSDISDIYI